MIPDNAKIYEAILSLYVKSTNKAAMISMHNITTAWNEETVNWNTIKHDASSIVTDCNISKSASWAGFNVAGAIRKMLSGSLVNNGFLLKSSELPEISGLNLLFCTKEESDPTLRPKLFIVYDGTNINNTKDVLVQQQTWKRGLSVSNDGISFTNAPKNGLLELYTADGSLIEQFKLTNDVSQLHFSKTLASGNYLIRLLGKESGAINFAIIE